MKKNSQKQKKSSQNHGQHADKAPSTDRRGNEPSDPPNRGQGTKRSQDWPHQCL